MKVLWVSHILPYPPKGGVLQRNYNLVKEISKYNKIDLITFNQGNAFETNKELKDAIMHLKTMCNNIEIVDVFIDKSIFFKYCLALKSLFTNDPYTVNWNKSRKMNIILLEYIKHSKPDIVHFDTIGLDVYSGIFYNSPKILNHHNIESEMMFRRSLLESNIVKKFYFKLEAEKLRKYENTNCVKYDSNITVSKIDQNALKNINKDINTCVIANGVDTSYFCPTGKIREEKNTLVFAGGMSWYPNRDAMIYFANEIWGPLKKVIPDVKFYLIGRNPPNKLKKIGRVDKSFVITGFVEDVRPYFERSSVYVCPIRDGGGTKLKILDALSMGKAIVATNVAVEGIDVKDNIHFMLANTNKKFIECIEFLINNNKERELLGSNARKLAIEKYDWVGIGKKINDIYNNIALKNKII